MKTNKSKNLKIQKDNKINEIEEIEEEEDIQPHIFEELEKNIIKYKIDETSKVQL